MGVNKIAINTVGFQIKLVVMVTLLLAPRCIARPIKNHTHNPERVKRCWFLPLIDYFFQLTFQNTLIIFWWIFQVLKKLEVIFE